MTLPMSTQEIRNRTEVVDCVNKARRIIMQILDEEKLVAIDLKGHQMKDEGTISIVSLALNNGCCYLFDLITNPNLFCHSRLPELLECQHVVKMMYDCRIPTYVLYKWFNIDLANVLDVQVACSFIDSMNHGCNPVDVEPVNLAFVSEHYGRGLLLPADHSYAILAAKDLSFWNHRPMYPKVVEYAAREVLCLLPETYYSIKEAIPPCYRKQVIDMIAERQINSVDQATSHQHACDFIDKLETLIEKEKIKINQDHLRDVGCSNAASGCETASVSRARSSSSVPPRTPRCNYPAGHHPDSASQSCGLKIDTGKRKSSSSGFSSSSKRSKNSGECIDYGEDSSLGRYDYEDDGF